MKIEGPGGVSPALGAKRTAPASGFAPSVDSSQRAAATTPTTTPTALNAILALQAEEPHAQRRQRQARRGKLALDALERLESGLLLGHAPRALMAELASLHGGAQLTGEAGLDDVLREIDTRVAVELAKLERVLEKA